MLLKMYFGIYIYNYAVTRPCFLDPNCCGSFCMRIGKGKYIFCIGMMRRSLGSDPEKV